MADHSKSPWRIAVRGAGPPDDIIVNDVSMFRAEMLGRRRLWLACYLQGTGVEGDRITFEVSVGKDGGLLLEVTERPSGQVVTE